MVYPVKSVRELEVYKLAILTAIEIFNITKQFPHYEQYSLTDQIRRSSRSVCSNLAEAWRKRKYQAAFISKLTDCEQEASETQTWLEFALKCKYIDEKIFNYFDEQYEHIYAMLVNMERKADSFCKN